MSWENDYGWEDNDFLSKPGKSNKKYGNKSSSSFSSKTPNKTSSYLHHHQHQDGFSLTNNSSSNVRDLSPIVEKKLLYEGKATSLQRTRAKSRKSKLYHTHLDTQDSSDDDEDDSNIGDGSSSMFSPQKNMMATATTPQKQFSSNSMFTPQKSMHDLALAPRSTSQKMKRSGSSGAVDSIKSKALAALSSSSARTNQTSPTKVSATGNQQHQTAFLPETHNKLMQSPYYRALFAASSVEGSSNGPPSLQPPIPEKSDDVLSPESSMKRLSLADSKTPSKADPSEETKIETLQISVPSDDSNPTPNIYWPPLSSSSQLFKDDNIVQTPSQRGRSSSMLRTPLRTPTLSRNVSYNSTSGVLEGGGAPNIGINSPFRQELSSSLFSSSAAVLEKEVTKPTMPSLPSVKNFMADFPKADQLPKVETMRLARTLYDRLIGDKQSKAVVAKKTKRWDDPDSEDEEIHEKGDDESDDDDKYIFEDFQTVLEDFHLPSPLPEVVDESVKLQSALGSSSASSKLPPSEATLQDGQPVKTPQPSKCFLFAASVSSFSIASDSMKGMSVKNGSNNPPKKKKLNYDLIDFVWFHQMLLSSSYINQDYLSLSEEERNRHSTYSELLLHHLIKKGLYYDLTNALTLEDDRFDSTRLELLKIIYEASPHLLFLDPEEEGEGGEDKENDDGDSVGSGSAANSDQRDDECRDHEEDQSIQSPSSSSSSESPHNIQQSTNKSLKNETEIEIPIRQIMANAVEHACSDRWQRCVDSTVFATCSELDSNFLAKRGFTQQVTDHGKALAAAELDYSLHAIVKSNDERPPYKVWDHDRNMVELMKHMIKREVKSCLYRLIHQEEDQRIWKRSNACLRSLCRAHQFMLRCYGHRLGQTSELVENQRLLTLLLDVLEGLLIWDFTLKVESLALTTKDEVEEKGDMKGDCDASFDAVHDYLAFIQRRWRLGCDNHREELLCADDDGSCSILNYAQEIVMAKSLEVVLIFARVIHTWKSEDDADNDDLNNHNSNINSRKCITFDHMPHDKDGLVNLLKHLQDLRQMNSKEKHSELLIHRCIRKYIGILARSDHVKLIQNILIIVQNESLLDNFFFGNTFEHNESRLFELVETLRTLRTRHWNPAIQTNSSLCLDLIVERMTREEDEEDYYDN